MDSPSIVTSLSGVLAVAAETTRGLTALVTTIRDAPKDIIDLRVELDNLSTLLKSPQTLTTNYPLRQEDDLQVVITPLAEAGSSRRSPIRMLSWMRHKEELRASIAKLRDRKASLSLAVSVMDGYLAGKTRDEIRRDIAAGHESMLDSFISEVSASKTQKQLEDDFSSIPDSSWWKLVHVENTNIVKPPNEPPPTIESETSGLDSRDHLALPQSETQTTLVQAAAAGDKAAVTKLLADGARVSERAAGGARALHVCAKYDDGDIAEVLIEHGAALDLKNDDRLTPLDVCLEQQSWEVAAILIEKGCRLGDFLSKILDAMQDAGEDACKLDPILKAVVKRFGEAGGGGPQLLHMALEREDSSALAKFLELGFDPNISEDGYTLLHQAVMRDRLDDAKLLIEKGANVDSILPPSARKSSRTESRHKLLVEKTENRDYNPLKMAADSLPMTQLLLAYGADVNVVFPVARDTILICFCAIWYLPVALEIVNNGADPNFHFAGDGCSPMYWAVMCANPVLLNALLDHGGNPDLKTWDSNGWMTPLHAAADAGRYEEAKILVERGADLSIRDAEGLTPLERARNSNKLDMVELLASHVKMDSPRAAVTRVYAGHGRGNR
ncbi:ankyrin [Diaporthe helianthi]|uniref:Ankyrin n=1 Tax=Diaporthe helianthi TaxID=158607 RepID=A0A2P5HKS6_DIAHE|nr:ankyrin [Diaporthe helianthi]